MVIDRGKRGDRTYYVREKQGYIAKNCWQRKEKEGRIVEMPQELVKDNREQ